MKPDQEYVSIQQVARHYGVSDDTVRGWAAGKILQSYYLPVVRKKKGRGSRTYQSLRFLRKEAFALARPVPWLDTEEFEI